MYNAPSAVIPIAFTVTAVVGYALCLWMLCRPEKAGGEPTPETKQVSGAGNWPEPYKTLQKKAEAGSAEAQYRLACLLAKGDAAAIPKDEEAARTWFMKAGVRGHVQAQHHLGVMFLAGHGGARDFPAARAWLETAARQGSAEAQMLLSLMAERGIGFVQDPDCATRMRQKARRMAGSTNREVDAYRKKLEAWLDKHGLPAGAGAQEAAPSSDAAGRNAAEEEKSGWSAESLKERERNLRFREHGFKLWNEALIRRAEELNRREQDLASLADREAKLKRREQNLNRRDAAADAREKSLSSSEQDMAQRERDFASRAEVQNRLFEERMKGFPWVAAQWALYRTKIYEQAEDWFRYKKHPASKTADDVRELRKLAMESERQAFMWRGIAGLYESLVPGLAELREEPESFAPPAPEDAVGGEEDPARRRLTDEEWASLGRQEKFQLALDRWKRRRKTAWEAGREYERFVGWTYERDGWDVSYVGALKGKEDLGRDLVAKKAGKTLIVQCKRWAAEKTVHEKHVIQLFGTCVLYDLEHGLGPGCRSKGVLACTCGVSDTARQCAERLGVEIRERLPMEDYPAVKCNIGASGERIYHLPFDQQYDRVKITVRKGERFCWTVKEAEELGFRRAFRWRGGSGMDAAA